MRGRISLRWRLILFSFSLALAIALVLATLLHRRTERQLLAQLEKTLETKCDEIITLLGSGSSHPSLRDFLEIETTYRYTPYVFFYLIRGGGLETVARSANLGDFNLALPEGWSIDDRGDAILYTTPPHPRRPESGRLLLRTERVGISRAGEPVSTFLIQVAVTLAPLEATMRANLVESVLVTGAGLVVVLFLLWFVTTWSLRPVTAMTRKASQITATNLRERLPRAGRNDELDELASVLNDMLDRLGASLRQMEQFSSDAAHQLRTPLTRIRGELDLILRGPESLPVRGPLEKVQEELERLSRVCGRLLLLARLDQQVLDTSVLAESVDLEGVVSELLDQMSPVAQERGVELRRGASAARHVRGSRPLLVEALLNLLDNAIRVTPTGGTVTVSVEANGTVGRVCVADQGPGVPVAERESIFLPFYRPAAASPQGDGSGLGLAIVKGIARAHGGRVELADLPDGGSVFRLVLPMRPPGS